MVFGYFLLLLHCDFELFDGGISIIAIVSISLSWVGLAVASHHGLVNLWTVVVVIIAMLATDAVVLLIHRPHVLGAVGFGDFIHHAHGFGIFHSLLVPGLVVLIFFTTMSSIVSIGAIIGWLIRPSKGEGTCTAGSLSYFFVGLAVEVSIVSHILVT